MDEIKERYESLHMNDDDLYDRIEALIERSTLRQEVIAANMRTDIAELKGEVKVLDAKIDSVRNELTAKIDGVDKKLDARVDGIMDAIALTNTRIDDTNTRIDDLISKQSNRIAKWGIIIAIGICAVQIAASVILHFWK